MFLLHLLLSFPKMDVNTSATATATSTHQHKQPQQHYQQQHQKQHVNNNKNGFVETNTCNVLNVLFCSVNTTESMIYFIQFMTTFWDSVSNFAICKSTTNSAHSFLFVKDIKKTQCKTKCDLYLLKVMVAKL